jgi:hypothetical protein
MGTDEAPTVGLFTSDQGTTQSAEERHLHECLTLLADPSDERR